MFVVASLALLATAMPQGGAGQSPDPAAGTRAAEAKPALLSTQEQAALRGRLREYLADDDSYWLADTPRDREKASRKRDKSKNKFEEDWAKFEKRGPLLGSMADLRAIFWNCFARKAPSHSKGQFREGSSKGADAAFYYWLPKGYDHETPAPALVVIPGSSGANRPGQWAKPRDHFRETYEKSALLEEFVVHVCELPESLEMDPVPDYGRDGAEIDEDRRHRSVMGTFGEVMNAHNIERSRIFVDCGRDTCGYGLRLMTLFPDRFAGIVLRQPVPVDDIRLGSLLNTPVLMLRTAATAQVVDALRERIEALSPNSVTIVDATDEYPHPAATPAIQEWLAGKKRDMAPAKVVLEPNHDRFNRAYWVDIGIADSVVTAPRDKMPRLEVEADRKNNRITVKAVGVEQFELLLNDDLVDLDKEFVVVVNDKAIAETRTRSFRDMLKRVLDRSDWDYLFPVRFETSVAKQ